MRARSLAFTTLVAALAGACSADNPLPTLGFGGGLSGIDTASNARIRLVNATATRLDLASNGVVAAGNAAIDFGEASSCTPTNALRPDLTVRVAGSLVPIPGLAAAYQSGVNYTVVAFTGSGVATQFATIADLFAPVLGEAALRVFNGSAAGTSYDVYVTVPGASLDSTPPTFSAVQAGTFSTFGNATAGTPRQVRITFAGSKNVLVDVGNTALIEGQVVTLVIVAPLAGSTRPRVFSAEACRT
ncbi:MAG TPA: hypothetical protein VJT85_02965 [Gemmatimonadaceae bacterium]|nr:hypothetical protein [Gemmatimonadaceae bacterium]